MVWPVVITFIHVNPTGYQAGFGFVYFLKAKWYHPSFIFTDSGKKIRPKEGTYLLFPYHLVIIAVLLVYLYILVLSLFSYYSSISLVNLV